MAKEVDKRQVVLLKEKPAKDLTLAETVFLQGLEIKELKESISSLRSLVYSMKRL